MKIRLKTIMAGPEGSAYPGQVIVIDADQGMSFIKGGYAELVETETAMIELPEKADIRPRGRRGRK